MGTRFGLKSSAQYERASGASRQARTERADLQQGRKVEVKPQPAGKAGADWIKVQTPTGG